MIDLASRWVVGWAMADHLLAELVCEALEMGLSQRRPGPGLIFHFDRLNPGSTPRGSSASSWRGTGSGRACRGRGRSGTTRWSRPSPRR